MSFLRTIEIINKIPLMMYRKILNYKHIFDIRRKEEGFDFLPDLIAISCVKEKASVSASVTVEAVLCVPLFLYAAVSLIWMLELRSIQSAVRCGLQSAGKQVAESFAEIPVLNPISLHADLVNAVGKERMDRSMIVGGSGGVSCKRSWAIPGMGVLELTAEYEVELPVPVFHIPVLHYKEKMRMKTWTGYVKTYEAGIGDNELVYVTETGIVYHRNYQCTYLEPSVRSVAKTQLGELRNSSGGIYHLCERCGWMPGNDGNCYVTDYGDRYHTSLSCSGLKRKVYTVPLSEVKGKGGCSKCGGKGQVVYTSQSFFGTVQNVQTCPDCHGTGKIIREKCPDCGGTGYTSSRKKIKVTIPAGIDNGQSVRIREKGEPGVNGGPRGDLLVEVTVSRHPIFQRQDVHIFSTAPISFAQAALGGDVRIKTVDGDVIYTVKPGTKTDTKVRLKGKGVPSLRNPQVRGDHYVTLVIQTPEKLSPEAKEVLRHFDQLTGNTLNQEEPASESKGKAKKKGFMDKLKETFEE